MDSFRRCLDNVQEVIPAAPASYVGQDLVENIRARTQGEYNAWVDCSPLLPPAVAASFYRRHVRSIRTLFYPPVATKRAVSARRCHMRSVRPSPLREEHQHTTTSPIPTMRGLSARLRYARSTRPSPPREQRPSVAATRGAPGA